MLEASTDEAKLRTWTRRINPTNTKPHGQATPPAPIAPERHFPSPPTTETVGPQKRHQRGSLATAADSEQQTAQRAAPHGKTPSPVPARTVGPKRTKACSASLYKRAQTRAFFSNAPRRTRTFDPLIKSQLLYQLS